MRALLASVALCLHVASPVHAVEIDSRFSPIAGSRWSIELSVRNTDAALPTLSSFVVELDGTLYSNLAVTASAPGWDSIVLQPDLALSSPGFFDALALSAGAVLSPGDGASGFALEVDFLGAEAPRALPFSIYDEGFILQTSGFTNVTVVPEPATDLLLLFGALPILTMVRRRGLARAGARESVCKYAFNSIKGAQS